jgi:uncharacterized membrane protein YoaK (UPF0700 family)
MKQYSKYSIAIAVCVSALAGYIDAIGFLELGGYFVSFMSGNTTRLAVAVTKNDLWHALLIGKIICAFVLGAIFGTLIGYKIGKHYQSFSVLLFVTLTLIAAILCYETGYGFAAILCMALAMGAVNTIFQRDGDIVIGLTYMTGTLVKFGQHVVKAFINRDYFAWFPYLILWLGLISGGFIGVIVFQLTGLHCLWLAATWAASLTLTVKLKPLY